MTQTLIEIGWNFQNSFARLPELFFTRQAPHPVPNPQSIIINKELAKLLGLNGQELETETGTAVLAGNQIPEGAAPLAQAYAGHQFGHFTMLGDGRAILVGEQITPDGKIYDLQLKGAGPTPYSRGGDGRAALGPMLREYLISEAMFALKIPTTRSLAVVTTGEKVYRETALEGAILARIASSHLRVGTFQYAATWGNTKTLRLLADYAINRHYPQLGGTAKYLKLLREVIKTQAALISKWMLAGFIHGVMNTDNMAISGETIDYGPCAFMDTFDPETVFSSIDQNGRYRYSNQPKIALWNLARFADALLPLLAEDMNEAKDLAESELQQFGVLYNKHQLDGMRSKLGLTTKEESDVELTSRLLQLMYEHEADYINTFLDLTFDKSTQKKLNSSPDFIYWKVEWQNRLARQPETSDEIKQLMQTSNPGVIPRNYQVEKALRAAVQDHNYAPFNKLLAVLKAPFDHTNIPAEFTEPPPKSMVPYRTFCGT